MFRKLCFLIGSVSLSMLSAAPSKAAADHSNSIVGSVSDGTASIPYRLFQPQGEAPGQKVPLILYLHGMGERGTDNVTQTTWMGNLAAKTSSGQYAAYVLAPQINTSMWFSSNSSKPSEAMSLTLQALHQAMNNPNVDQCPHTTGSSRGAWPGTSNHGYMPGFCVPGRPLSSKPMRPLGVQ